MENSIFLKGIGWNEKVNCNRVKASLNTEYMNVLLSSDIMLNHEFVCYSKVSKKRFYEIIWLLSQVRGCEV